MGSSQCLCYFLETEASSRWLTRLREARARLSTRSDEKAGGWRVRKREKHRECLLKNLVFADNICEKRTNTRMEERRVEPGMEPVLFTLFICESVASWGWCSLQRWRQYIVSFHLFWEWPLNFRALWLFPILTSLVLWPPIYLESPVVQRRREEKKQKREILQRANSSINRLVKVKIPLRRSTFFSLHSESCSLSAHVLLRLTFFFFYSFFLI